MKINSLFLPVIFFALLSSRAFSQTVYEYGSIRQNGHKIILVTNDKIEENVVDKGGDNDIQQGIFKSLSELSKDGWETYSASLAASGGSFSNWPMIFIRRKKQ